MTAAAGGVPRALVAAAILCLLPASAPLWPAVAEEPPTEAAKSPADRGAAPVAAFDGEVVVTAAGIEQPADEASAPVVVISGEELGSAAAPTVDDALRHVPGFTLFRRSGSRTANPTTQGASLRGVGGSGAGRALVLADGIALADPFGGWVAWGRLPRAAIERIEVVRGGTSGLYGSAALAGVIQIVRRDSRTGRAVVDLSAGSRDTAAGSLWTGVSRGAWAASIAAEALETDGHVPVAHADRGAVDRRAGTRHRSLELSLDRDLGSQRSLALRAGAFDERRNNGTILQENATRILHGSAGFENLSDRGLLAVRAWGAEHDFDQSFTAVADDRDSETLVRVQRVPAHVLGGAVRWTASAGARHTLLIAAEAERREGTSHERAFFPGGTSSAAVGGLQTEAGVQVEDVARIGRGVSLVGAVRYDRWHNEPAAGTEARARDESFLSPRLAVRWQLRPPIAVVASAYRSFRAPTLNELYRGFRVGDVVTEPNAGLDAERLTGVEAGVSWTPARRPELASVAATLFWMHLDDPIANVTVDVGGEVIRRQRRNLGSTRSRGLEVDAEARMGSSWSLGAAALWADAEVVDFPADPELEGRRPAQVPELEASARVRWQGRRSETALYARWSGRQYDDDRNRLPLEAFFLADLRAAWRLRPALEIYLAAENLLDEEVTVGRTPLRTMGSPRLLRVGVRWSGGER